VKAPLLKQIGHVHNKQDGILPILFHETVFKIPLANEGNIWFPLINMAIFGS
jgi:hypothetical protein